MNKNNNNLPLIDESNASVSSSSFSSSSLDSAQEELLSLRRISTENDVVLNQTNVEHKGTKPGLFGLGNKLKAFSTNSSPIKSAGSFPIFKDEDLDLINRSYSQSSSDPSTSVTPLEFDDEEVENYGNGTNTNPNHPHDINTEFHTSQFTKDSQSHDDSGEDDYQNINFDPFIEKPTDQPIANSTVFDSPPQQPISEKKRFKVGKSVRFNDWEEPFENKKDRLRLQKRKRLFHRHHKSIAKLSETGTSNQIQDTSSDYSTAPEATGKSLPLEHHLSKEQLAYILPDVIEPLDSSSKKKTSRKSILKGSPPLMIPNNIISAASSSSNTNTAGLFSKDLNTAEISPASTAVLNENLDNNSARISSHDITMRSAPFDSDRRVTENVDEDVSISLARRFNNLMLDQTNPAGLRMNPPSSSHKGFTFRLTHDNSSQLSKGKHVKSLFKSSSPEISVNQIDDILDQDHPQLPNITDSTLLQNFKSISKSDLSIPLFDELTDKNERSPSNGEVVQSMKQIALQLFDSLNNDFEHKADFLQNMGTKELIGVVKELAQTSSRRLESFKIQQIKFDKQLLDHENFVLEKEKQEKLANEKLQKLLNQVDTLKNDAKEYEAQIVSQSQTITLEREACRATERELITQNSLLTSAHRDLSQKEAFVQLVTPLVNQTYKRSCFHADAGTLDTEAEIHGLLRDTTSIDTKRQDELTIERLKKILQDHETLKNDLDGYKKLKSELEEQVTQHKSSSKLKDDENNHLKDLLLQAEFKISKLEVQNQALDKSLLTLHEETGHLKEILKSAEFTIKDHENNLKNMKYKLLETEEEHRSLAHDLKVLTNKHENLEQIFKDQLDLVKEANAEIEDQNRLVSDLQDQKERLEKERQETEKERDMAITKAENLESRVLELKLQLDKHQHQQEILGKQRNYQLKNKEDECKDLKKRIEDLEHLEAQLTEELRDTRNKLSDKFRENSQLESKIINVSKTLQDVQESSRALRSDILKSGAIKQQLKRTLIELSVCLVKNFEGIVDEASLSTVREELQSDLDCNDEKQVDKLIDIVLFIEEALSLVVKEYWLLTKRISDSQRSTLSNSSLVALQRINDVQAQKLKKYEKKIHYYEAIFNKINMVNVDQRSKANLGSHFNQNLASSSGVSSTSDGTVKTQSSRSQQSQDQQQQLMPLNQSQQNVLRQQQQVLIDYNNNGDPSNQGDDGSDVSVTTATTLLKEKQSEINRLLSRVKRDRNLDY